MISKRVLLSLLTLLTFLWAGEIKLKSKIEPILRLEQKGNTSDSGTFDLGFNRLKLYSLYEKEMASGTKLKSKLDLDFSGKSLEDIVKEAIVEFSFIPQVSLKAGHYKVPLLPNDYSGSSSLSHIDRNIASHHLRDALGVTGYMHGLSINGRFLDEKIRYEVGFFYNEELDRKGISGGEVIMLPSVNLQYEPVDFLHFEYGALFPEFSMELLDETIKKKRLILQSVAVSFDAPRLYCTELELLIGVDTADGKEMMAFQSTYDENLSMSLYSNHTFTLPLRESANLILSLAGEFLNGLTYYDGMYHDRSFTYALWSSVGFEARKDLIVRLSLSERFDTDFKAVNQKDLALQLTYSPTLLRWRK